jgi:ferredoxin
MKVTIDRDQCISCGGCWTICPELFEEDPSDGKSRITAQYRSADDIGVGEAPESLRESGQAAADGCPMSIIHIGPPGSKP